jgi:RNA polymerase sigma-70 factor, ECF subfamily
LKASVAIRVLSVASSGRAENTAAGAVNPPARLSRIAREMDDALCLRLDHVSLPSPPTARTMPTVNGELADAELLARIGEGDENAFEILYRRYARPVLGLALRRLGDRGRAEEALQEAFVSVWRSASTYRPERGAATAWLYAVARNAIADRGRRRQEPAMDPPDEPSPDAGPEERAEHAWLSWRVHRALEELPERERELIALAYWGELSQSEIAERLDIPLGTVKTRTRSALARLADALEEEVR